MRHLRFLARVGLLAGAVAAFVPLHYLWRLLRLPSSWPTRFLAAATRISGVRARLVGQPLRRDVLILANHSSWLDILLLGGIAGTAFVAKAELRDAPVVGWLAGLNRTVFVQREDRRAMPTQIAAIRQAIACGALAIFPEGTTSDGTVLLPFKASLLAVLDPPAAGIMVQPVFIDYGAAAAEIAWGQENGDANARRLLSRRGTLAVTVHCLAPFDPSHFADRKAIAAEARRRIADVIAANGGGLRIA